MTKGTLTVTVVSARDLKDEDLIGKSDPYVELWLDKDYKQRTTTKKNTLNPTWNETFTFNVDRQKHLYLRVLDDDFLSSDDKMGDTKIDINEVVRSHVINKEYKLPALLGLRSDGYVLLDMKFAAA